MQLKTQNAVKKRPNNQQETVTEVLKEITFCETEAKCVKTKS